MTMRFMRAPMPRLQAAQRFVNRNKFGNEFGNEFNQEFAYEFGHAERRLEQRLGGLAVKVKTLATIATLAVTLPCVAHTQAASRATTKTTAPSSKTVSTAADSAAAAAAWAKADTGRMMPGYRDLSAYDRPGYCLAAVRGREALAWRRGESDTLPKRTAVDTIPTVAREIGRACMAKMTPRTVPRTELYNLMRLALYIGDTALARQTVEYELSVTSGNPRDRGYVLADAIYDASNVRPMQIPFMESLLPRFAELGKGATEPALVGYGSMYAAAHNRFDTATMLRNSVTRETLIEKLTPEERQEQDVWLGGVFVDSVDIVWYQHVPALSPTINRLMDQWADVSKVGTLNPQLAQGLTALATTAGTVPGQSAPNFKIFKRYPVDAPFPFTPGKVTIVLPLRGIGRGRLDEPLGRMRRLYERYHSRGLEVVLVGRTAGYAWGSPPLAAEQEADLFGWYYREHLKLPFTVVVEETSFSTKPDGRKVPAPSPFLTMYSPLSMRGYILGRDGSIKTINYGFHNESELEAYILRELAIPTSTAQEAK